MSIHVLVIECSLNYAVSSANYTAAKGRMMTPLDTDLKLQYKVPRSVIFIHVITQAFTQVPQKPVETKSMQKNIPYLKMI